MQGSAWRGVLMGVNLSGDRDPDSQRMEGRLTPCSSPSNPKGTSQHIGVGEIRASVWQAA